MGFVIAIAFVLGVLVGSLVPFTVYYYRHTRSTQGLQPTPVGYGLYRSEKRLLDGPPPLSLAGDEEPLYMTNLGFRVVPERRRGRRPVRPGPRGSIVR